MTIECKTIWVWLDCLRLVVKFYSQMYYASKLFDNWLRQLSFYDDKNRATEKEGDFDLRISKCQRNCFHFKKRILTLKWILNKNNCLNVEKGIEKYQRQRKLLENVNRNKCQETVIEKDFGFMMLLVCVRVCEKWTGMR